jgi:hypothetical protein
LFFWEMVPGVQNSERSSKNQMDSWTSATATSTRMSACATREGRYMNLILSLLFFCNHTGASLALLSCGPAGRSLERRRGEKRMGISPRNGPDREARQRWPWAQWGRPGGAASPAWGLPLGWRRCNIGREARQSGPGGVAAPG